MEKESHNTGNGTETHRGMITAVDRSDAPAVSEAAPSRRTTGPRYSVRIINTDHGFDDLESRWNEVLDGSDATVFQTFEWSRTWWKYFGKGHALHIVLAENGSGPVGMFPLFLQRVTWAGIPVARRLQFLGAGLSDYVAPIVLRGHEAGVLAGFAGYLVDNQHVWDVFDLEDINEDSPHLPLICRAFAEAGLPVYRYQGNVCPRIALPETVDEFSASLGSSASYNLKRKTKRLKANFTSGVELVTSGAAEIETAVADFSRIHGGRWTQQGFPSAFDDPHHRAFHLEAFGKFAARDWLRIFFLRVDGQRVAISLNFNFRSRIYMYQSNAFATGEIMKCSPGLLIRSSSMTAGISEGMRIFDFMRGSESYKYREGNAVDSRNWLIRTSAETRAGKMRFRMYLVSELLRKSADRLRREYYEYRRHRINNGEGASGFSYVFGKCGSLLRLGAEYFSRHRKRPSSGDFDQASGEQR